MPRAPRPRRALGLLVPLVAVTLAGCPAREPEAAAPVNAGPAVATPEPTVPAEAAGEGHAPESFAWTEHPAIEDIPARPVEGQIEGMAMTEPRTEVTAEADGRYRLKFVVTAWAFAEERAPTTEDRVPSAADQVATVMLYFTLAGDRERSQGESGPLQWAMGEGATDAEASYAYTSDPYSYTLYANRDWAGALEIARWEDGLPVAGRIALCFNDVSGSWVAGEFEAEAGTP